MHFPIIILASLCLVLVPEYCEALRCYACSYTSPADHLCLNDPISVEGQSIVECHKKYCTIFRQELQTPSGTVNSFLRDCQEVPVFLNNVVEDDTFKTFYRSCTTDLCNSGNGIGTGTSILNPDTPGENMYVLGIDGGATGIIASGLMLLIGGLLAIFRAN